MKYKSFVPDFVLNEYKKGKYHKELFAHILIIDISGFTELTQLLMDKGSAGAEELAKIIRKLFDPLIALIEQNHGFISSFAGDSFIAIFPDNEVAHIDFNNLTSQIILTVDNYNLENRFDIAFSIAIKVGVGFGETTLDIFNSDYYSTYLFSGDGVDSAIQAIMQANRGEIKYSFPKSDKTHETDQKVIDYNGEIYQNYNKFLPPILRSHDKIGEFRKVVSCFIAFKESDSNNKFITRVMNLSLRYGGYFNKVDYSDKGMVVLVIFGAPKAYQDAPVRACNFALEVKSYQQNISRIGISYGEAYAGFVGSNTRGEYTVLGMSINLSAQMAIQANLNEILVDKYIFNKARKSFKIIMKGYRNYKGFKTKVPTYVLSSQKFISEFLSFNNKFISREKELITISNKINESMTKVVSKILNIYGDEGVGKTRLVAEAVNLLGKSDHTWAYMECDSVLRKNYNPLISYFKYFFKINDSDDYQENHQKIVKVIDALALNVSNKTLIHELNSGLILLENLIGIKEFNVDNVDSEIIKNRYENTLYAITNIFRLLSLNLPTVMVFDNFDHIDPESYNFLHYFYPLIQDYPITIFILSRSQIFNLFDDLDIPHHNKFFKLDNLNREDSVKMIESFLHDDIEDKIEITEKFLTKIIDQSKGNPFYIEQIVSYIKRQKLLKDDKYQIEESYSIPDTIEAMIIERIDNLDDILKKVVKVATVLGNKFDKRILQEMMGGNDISRFLAEGEIENLWYPALEFNYVFRNAIYRECIYKLMLHSQSRNIHKKALMSMEKVYKDNLQNHYEELIYNSINGEMSDKAINYLRLAIDDSIKYHKYGATLKYCSHLREYMTEKQIINEEIMIDTRLKEIEVNLEESRIDVSNKDIEELQEVIEPNTPAWIKLNYLKAKSLFIQEKFSELVTYTQEIADLFEGTEYKIHLTIYYLDSLRYLNRGEEFEKISIELLDKYLDSDNDLYISRIANLLGVYFMEKSKYYDALHYFKLNLNLVESLNTTNLMASGAHNIGVMTYHLGDKYQAKSYYLKALKYSEETGNRINKCKAMSDLAMLEYNEKNVNEALELLLEALEIARLSHNTNQVSRILYNFSLIHISNNEYDQALSYAIECREIGIKMSNLRTQSFVNNIIAQIYIKKGSYSSADALIRENIEHQKKIEDLEGVANSHGLLGILYKAQKKYLEAAKNFEEEFKILNSLGSKQSEGIALFNWATCDIESKNINGAKTKLNEALAVFTKCNYESGIQQVNKLLASLSQIMQ
ncbi:tetratricopeptide repeat protein [bacterium]|nr:tetratricopeptide repeat protein [bacterium]